MKTPKIAAIVAFVLALAAATAWTWKIHSFPTIGIDDANIFFSYAENLASGNGFTYARNGEPVEGFTSILWTVICAVSFYFGLDELGVFVFAFILFVVTQFLLLGAIRNATLPPDRNARFLQVIYAALVLSSPSYITWMTITLMDTSLWGFIIAVMTYFLVSPPRSKLTIVIAAIAFGLAPAARPEALLVAPVFLALLWLRLMATCRKHAVRMCLCLALAFVATAVGLTIFRIQYFGYPFPNTYYAKVSPSIIYNLREGLYYIYGFALSGNVVSTLSLVPIIRVILWISETIKRLLNGSLIFTNMPTVSAGTAVSFATVTLLGIPVITGGDHFGLFRFFQPAYPLIILSAILSVIELPALHAILPALTLRARREYVLQTVAIGFVIACWFLTIASRPSWISMHLNGSPIDHEFRIAENGIHNGHTLYALVADSDVVPTLGVITAGGVARTYSGKIIDLMGLNNSTIAHYPGERRGTKNHAAFETDAFFLVEPDILLLKPIGWAADLLKGLCSDPRFIDSWRYGRIYSSHDHSRGINVLINSNFYNIIGTNADLEYYDLMYWSNKWVEATILPKREN